MDAASRAIAHAFDVSSLEWRSLNERVTVNNRSKACRPSYLPGRQGERWEILASPYTSTACNLTSQLVPAERQIAGLRRYAQAPLGSSAACVDRAG